LKDPFTTADAALAVSGIFDAPVSPGLSQAVAQQFEDWDAKFQATYIWQGKRSFSALYSGDQCFSADKERALRLHEEF
jgi:hypothetical protein